VADKLNGVDTFLPVIIAQIVESDLEKRDYDLNRDILS
jgi:hypothetical protein